MTTSTIRVALLASLLVGCATSSATLGDDDEGSELSGDVTTEAATLDDADAVFDAAALPVKLEALFAVPLANGAGDSTLEDKVVQLIGQAPKGSHIRVALYHFTHTRPARALVDAFQRGVLVDVILDKQENLATAGETFAPGEDEPGVSADDGDDEADSLEESADDDLAAAATGFNSAVEILRKGLPAANLILCTRGDGACQGNHINHNKMFLFSSLSDGSKTVVVQSSANLTTFKLHNNLVISRNDKALYDGYVQVWNALKARKQNLDFYRSVKGAHTIGYFYPRAEGDTILSVLDNVKCTSASKIRIAMAFFTDGRKPIADKLVGLERAGCDVQVVMRKAGPQSSAKIIKELKDGHIKVGLYPDSKGANIHSKYLLIDSKYDTAGAFVTRKLVYTGSHNYTGGALRNNDETLLRVDNAAVFAQFLANWNTIRAQIP
jgi:phosphatidylserine/phosphatidylglycerophosphate/cardiolipin synthase-like enzyme